MKKTFKTVHKFEFETDRYGYIKSETGRVQIKVRQYWNDRTKIVGIMTFYINHYDYEYKGILKKGNSRMLLDIWFNTGIADFALNKLGDDWYLQVPFKTYFGNLKLIDDFQNYVSDHPEYKFMKIEI